MTANILVFTVVGAVVIRHSTYSESNSPALNAVGSGALEPSNPIDELSSADIAVHVARVTSLPEATAVTNNADSANAKLAVASADDSVISKPQVISDGLKSKKDIKRYKTVAGDTVASVAAKFGITSETVRLSNNLGGDSLTPGVELIISPVNGLVYKVQAGDTPATLASKYRASVDQIIAFNDVELTGSFATGDLIVIPDGLQPISSRYNYASAGNRAGFSYGTSLIYKSNAYDYGWCTWHAANRRAQIGRPIPSNLGNAITWLGIARSAGLPTGAEPQAGAVLYHLNIGGLGHVAFVEKVNSDGSYLVSDMNYPTWGKATYRTVPASEKGNYRFIY